MKVKTQFPYLLALLIPIFIVSTAFSPLSKGKKDQPTVLIDGKEIIPEGVIKMKKDDMIQFEVEGLMPHSIVNFKAKKFGVTLLKDNYQVNAEGKISEVLYIPNLKVKLTCQVDYRAFSGKYSNLKFRFKIK